MCTGLPSQAGWSQSILRLIISSARQLQEQAHPAHAKWIRGAGIALQNVRLKNVFASSLVALSHRQAELDAFFLFLYSLLTHLSKHTWQLHAAAIYKGFSCHIHGYIENQKLQHGVHRIFSAVQDMSQPLQWDPCASWPHLARHSLRNRPDIVCG